jgi:hypothetical protein
MGAVRFRAVHSDGVVVSVLFPSTPVALSCQSGYAPTGQSGVVTRVEGRRLREINGQPAAQAYHSWTGGKVPMAADTSVSILAAATLWPMGRVTRHLPGCRSTCWRIRLSRIPMDRWTCSPICRWVTASGRCTARPAVWSHAPGASPNSRWPTFAKPRGCAGGLLQRLHAGRARPDGGGAFRDQRRTGGDRMAWNLHIW